MPVSTVVPLIVVTEPETEALMEKIEYLARGARFVVLAGSLPRKVPEDFYAVVMQRIRRHRCFVVLDSAGEPLRLGEVEVTADNLRTPQRHDQERALIALNSSRCEQKRACVQLSA